MANFYAKYPANTASALAVTTVQGEGIAGTPTGGLLTVQGDPAGTPIPISGNITASSASVGPTGSAVPAAGDYVGLNNGGTLIGAIGDSAGRQIIAGAGTPGAPAGGVLSVQNVDLSLTANVTAQDVGSATTAGANAQSIVTGTPTAGSVANFALSGQSGVKVQILGTWTGTLVTEVSLDAGVTWVGTGIHQSGTAYTVGSVTANALGGLNVSGCTNFRVRATTAWTGTAAVRAVETNNVNSVYLGNAVKLADATTQSTQNTIKAASTAAQSTDTSFVIAVSPNSPLPVGTNKIGALTTVDTVTAVTTVSTVTAVTGITNALPAGSNIIGNVRIDQTTAGTTNGVQVKAYTTTAAVFQAEGAVAFGSITASYVTLLTPSAATKIIQMRNNTNAAISVSFDAGTTTNYTLDSGDAVSIDLNSNFLIMSVTAIQVKYAVGAPTSGSFRINACH